MNPQIKALLETIGRAVRQAFEAVRELMRRIGEYLDHLDRLRIASGRYAERERLIVQARAVGMPEAEVRPFVEWIDQG